MALLRYIKKTLVFALYHKEKNDATIREKEQHANEMLVMAVVSFL